MESKETAGPPQCESCGRPTPPQGAHPLALIRHRRGWTYQRTAELIALQVSRMNLGIMSTERQKIWRWEHRGRVPEPAAQVALASLLGVDSETVQREGWPGWLRTVPGPGGRGAQAVRS
ncbi:hypothetical protein [Frankia sp. AvcI1]|uniref:hypothetical protein n=1 Tax=Frankia sp. AvcI1 TaxID=573496 RepID=UPI002119AF25|nr:hypothetical protein [Frankia sp. AvcI1]